MSRNFYVRGCVRKWNKGNAWKVARKRKSWTLLNFSFKLSTFYLALRALTCVTAKNALVEINLKALIQAPSAHIRFCLKTAIFFLRFRLPSTCIRWKRSPKTHLFKTLSRVKIFEKRWPLAYARKDKNGRVFRIQWCSTSFTTTITHPQRFRMSGRKRFEYVTSGSVFFFENGGTKICFQKYSNMCGRGLRHFHVVVVQKRQRNVQRSVVHVRPSRCHRIVGS